MRSPNQLLRIGSQQSPFQGVMNMFSPENLPPYIFQKLINYEIAHEIGKLKKRDGYGEVITGQTGLTEMKELVAKNGARLLGIQKDTSFYESVYSGGSYGALSRVDLQSNDYRYQYPYYPGAGTEPSIYRMYPHVYQYILRSGAGINAVTDLPIWYGYIDAQTRYPDATSESIAAGRYMTEQLLYKDLLKFVITFAASEQSCYSTILGLNKDTTIAKKVTYYAVPVYDGYQIGFPSLENDPTTIQTVNVPSANNASHMIQLSMRSGKQDDLPRLTHIDIFASIFHEGG